MLKILIAEDEPKIRRGLKNLIRSFDVPPLSIEEAANGRQALEVAKKFEPHLLIADINMPFLNGLDLIESIKKVLPQVTILILTGYDDFDYARKALQLKVEDYLLKPVDEDLLYEYVKKSFDKVEKDILQKFENESASRHVKVFIDKYYYDSSLTLESVANQFRVSDSYIKRLMKMEMGISFVDYLTKVRIEAACELLRDEDFGMKMYEIAEKVGYNSQHYFSRVFKKVMGITAIEYKKRL